jgi:hypothetical protein
MLLTKMKKPKQDIVLSKCGFNFLLANWFNYVKPIIQFKACTNIYKVKITLLVDDNYSHITK